MPSHTVYNWNSVDYDVKQPLHLTSSNIECILLHLKRDEIAQNSWQFSQAIGVSIGDFCAVDNSANRTGFLLFLLFPTFSTFLFWSYFFLLFHQILLLFLLFHKKVKKKSLCVLIKWGKIENTLTRVISRIKVKKVKTMLIFKEYTKLLQSCWNRLTVLCPLQHSSTYFCPYRIEHELPSQALEGGAWSWHPPEICQRWGPVWRFDW